MSESTHDNQGKTESDSPSTWRPPEPRPGRGFWAMMLFTIVAVGGLAYFQYRRVDKIRHGGEYATPVSNLPILGHVPDFDLIERNGQAITLSNLRGKVWIADFIFTSCGGPCPIMTRRMGEFHRTLKREALSGVTTVSISVDPLRDTPKQLIEYATIHHANDQDWLFLTGGEKEIRDLSVDGFKLPVEPEEGTDQVIHSTRFVLVDRRGDIRGYYEIVLNEELDMPRAEVIDKPMPAKTKRKLLADIRTVLAEKAPA